MAKSEEIVMYCGGGRTNRLAERIIDVVNNRRIGEAPLKLSHTDFGTFPDGEFDYSFYEWKKIKGKHAVLFLSTHSMELAFQLEILIRAIKKRYEAKSLVVVLPFMAFRRQDHPEIMEEFDLNAGFIENIRQNGADQLIVCDIHSDRTKENCQAVGLEMHHVKPTPLYAAALHETMALASKEGIPLKVVSPDKGSILRCISLAQKIDASVVVSLKRRKETGNIVTQVTPSDEESQMIVDLSAEHNIKIELISPEVIQDTMIILREDELDTGGTAADTGRDLRKAKARQVELVVTHMKCSPGWKRKVVRKSPFSKIYAGDTIYRDYENTTGGLIKTISTDAIIGAKLAKVLNAL